ncbi:MAG: hypothetical protein AB2A00_26385 [Myxococcota bacterium]
MTTINRGNFNQHFQNGINTNSPDLANKLQGSGVSTADVKKADLDGDGTIKGQAELDAAFKLVDSFDRNGSGSSFSRTGKSGQLFDAFNAGRVGGAGQVQGNTNESRFGQAIVQAAADRVERQGEKYAYDSAPKSPHPNLSGNRGIPNRTELSWLKNNNKCNQFVGDTLTQAGVKAPTVKMADGTVHYAKAEDWPKHSQLFDRITDPSQIRPGDVLVKDYPGSGESTAHTEVVTGTNPMKVTGAHHDGAYESNNDWLAGTTYNAQNKSFTQPGGTEVYVLRPKQAF